MGTEGEAPPPRWRAAMRGRWLAAALCVVALGSAAHGYRDRVVLQDRGVVTQSVVVRVVETRYLSSLVVQFSPVGGAGLLEARVREFRSDPEPQPGEIVPVRYDPQDPTGRIVDARLERSFVAIWVVGAAGLGLALWATVGVTWRQRHRAATR